MTEHLPLCVGDCGRLVEEPDSLCDACADAKNGDDPTSPRAVWPAFREHVNDRHDLKECGEIALKIIIEQIGAADFLCGQSAAFHRRKLCSATACRAVLRLHEASKECWQ